MTAADDDSSADLLAGLRFSSPEAAAAAVLKRIWYRDWEREENADNPLYVVPVDPVAIADTLGIDVYGAVLPADVYGKVVRRGGTSEIFLNLDDPKQRTRFTCAHEIGHLIDPRGSDVELIDNRDSTSSSGNDPFEVYANRFAAALLMPKANVDRMRARHMSVLEMAREFEVSGQAMSHRLARL